MLHLVDGLAGLDDGGEVHRPRSDYLLVLSRLEACLLARLLAPCLPIVDGGLGRSERSRRRLEQFELLLVLLALIAHDYLERAAELCRVGRTCLNLLRSYNMAHLLAKELKQREFGCGEQESGVSVVDIDS